VTESKSVTRSLPRGLPKQAKRLAADEDTSVSAMKAATSLGTQGAPTWVRDSLHER
jgi:hypothetical protein